MGEFTVDLLKQVRLSDLMDIALISVLLYATLIWLRDRASRSLRLIILTLMGVFFLARWLDLYLTSMVFHYGAVGIVLALVVVFQNDLRHGFERLTSARVFRRSIENQPSSTLIDTIVAVVVEMARERMGGLIIFPGRQPLDRHLRGGVSVDAKISQPLLLSIFHPKSPGHDGAVLIERSRISQLGLQLPLTSHLSKIQGGGTRHAAALGLAECSDAIVLAISEERGTITFAHDGELSQVEPAKVEELLRRYVFTQATVNEPKTMKNLVEAATMFAALTCAISMYFLFAYRTDTIQRTFVVPIEYRNISDGWEIQEPMSTRAEVTLSGTEQAFAVLDPTGVAVSLEVGKTDGRNPIHWETGEHLKNVPTELRVESIRPQTVISIVQKKSEP